MEPKAEHTQYRCPVCTQLMEVVDDFSWMCERCRSWVRWYRP